MFKTLQRQMASATKAFDVLIALGTHPPMSEEAIWRPAGNFHGRPPRQYRNVHFFNHDGITRRVDGSRRHSGKGHTRTDRRVVLDGGAGRNQPAHFQLRSGHHCRSVFPHEVVGFSGGNKYLFPGGRRAEILNFFHWLGAVCTNPMIIGNKWTPVRKVVDRAGAL